MTFGVLRSMFKVIKATAGLLSSSAFLIWLIGGWILYYVSSMIWTKESFAYFIAGMGSNLFIKIPFLLFLLSGYLHFIRVFIRTFRMNKGQLLTGVFLHIGILLFFTGFFISASARQFDWIVAGAGDSIQPKWSTEKYRMKAIDPGLKERFLDIDIGSGKGLFKYEPKFTLQDRLSRTFEVGAFPATKIDDTYYHILNFGLSPGMSLSEGDEVKAQGRVPLKILGPGSTDFFEIQPLPYKFLISLEPEKVIRKGALKASEFNIRSPLYRVRVLEGEKVIAEAVSKESILFNNMKLVFFEPGYWVQMEVVKDRGVPFIISGIFLIAAGLPLFMIGVALRIIQKNIFASHDM